MGAIVYNIIAIAIIGCSYANPIDFNGGMGRIANGMGATDNQFPYAISLQHLSPSELQLDTRGHRCGGALITLRHALTTATCLHETVDDATVVLTPSHYRVFAGSAFLTNDTADRIRNVINFTIHPGYLGPPAFVNDIGVIALVTPFAAGIVTPIALPNVNFNPPDFTECLVAGWGGLNASESGTSQLQFANKYIYNQQQCTIEFNIQIGLPNIMPTMVCSASTDIVSSGCINDDGNALVCQGTLTGVLFMHDHCRGSSTPEIYTRVSNYTVWIQTVSASPALFTPAVFVMVILFSIAQLFLNKY